jgi:hypothetical protein
MRAAVGNNAPRRTLEVFGPFEPDLLEASTQFDSGGRNAPRFDTGASLVEDYHRFRFVQDTQVSVTILLARRSRMRQHGPVRHKLIMRKTCLVTNIVLLLLPAVGHTQQAVAQQTTGDGPVLTTTHFAFFSDLATNVDDALVTAAIARRAQQPDPLADAADKACYDRLASTDREGWTRAVDYYAAGKSTNFQRVLRRLELAGLVRRVALSDAANRQFLEEVAALRDAATPSYRQCRWQAQDARNRRWIDGVAALLAIHEASLGQQLPKFFKTPWAGLPFRVDVVDTAAPAGANSAGPDFPTLHILVSSSNSANQDRAALEIVFHEASHFLATPDSPLGKALEAAFSTAGVTVPRDFVHQVHFFMTGEAVRREMARASEPPYTPYLYAVKLFSDNFRESVSRTWPAYMDGNRTLEEAAGDLVRAMNPPPPR